MREDRTHEFKSQYTSGFLKTVSAFANYEGGTVYFGYSDEGEPVGLDNPKDVCLRIENAIHDAISPQPEFSLAIDEVTATVQLVVERGALTPYLYKGKAYCRRDSSTVEVSRQQYNNLMLEGLNTTFDALECGRDDLTFTVLAARLKEDLGIEELDRGALISLELMTPAGAYTNAGLLFADNNTLPGVDIARFGESINIIEGRKTFDQRSVLAMIDATMEYFDEIYGYEEIAGTQREQKWRIPREAFREAVANALVHREWGIHAQVQVAMYRDRVTVTSPGGLPQDTNKERYLHGGYSVPRNPTVANLFFRLGYIERFGTGVPRIRAHYANDPVKPLFDVDNACISVTLPALDAAKTGEAEAAIMSALAAAGELTREEISSLTGQTKPVTLRALNTLIEQGAVQKTGAGRSTRYTAGMGI